VVTLDEALDQLYGVEADAFVAERKRLAREFKDAGDSEAADAVAKARKPTVAAWALNQLARTQRRDVDLLLDAGHRLRQAQEGVVGGADRGTFEQAQKTERDAVRRLTQQASELLGGASSQALAQGRFTTPLEAEGFDVFGALPPRPAEAPPARPDPGSKRKAKEELRAAKARVRELERKVGAAARAAANLEAEWKESERAAESARVALADAEKELEDAEQRAK